MQSVVVDPADRLWIVDTGSINFGPTTYGGPKLIGVDLRTNRVFSKILVPPEVALPTSYLNDVRFDLRRGAGGLAFLTDSSGTGPNGIVVVDLATKRSWRRLHDHPSTKAEPGFLPLVEGRPVLQRKPGQPPQHLGLGSDGIAMGAGGERLYYCPLASRRIYSVSVDALSDPRLDDAVVASTVTDHGDKGMSLADDGWLYVTANQLHRGPGYHNGTDLRRKPYVLFRTRVGRRPVRLV